MKGEIMKINCYSQKQRLAIYAGGIIIALSSTNIAAGERDPFVPFGGASGTDSTPVSASTASSSTVADKLLQAHPASSYRLIGLISAQKRSIAVVQTRDARTHIVHPGDLLGKEGGRISSITKDGLTITVDNEPLVTLVVNNPVEKIHESR